MSRLVGWERADGNLGHGMGRLERVAGGWRVHGAEVVTGPGERYACFFAVVLDDGWVTVDVTVEAFGPDGVRGLRLTRDADGAWRRDGEPRPELDGCLDVDVAAAPVTNTILVRRLSDAVATGDAVTVPVAWVDVRPSRCRELTRPTAGSPPVSGSTATPRTARSASAWTTTGSWSTTRAWRAARRPSRAVSRPRARLPGGHAPRRGRPA